MKYYNTSIALTTLALLFPHSQSYQTCPHHKVSVKAINIHCRSASKRQYLKSIALTTLALLFPHSQSYQSCPHQLAELLLPLK